MTLKSKYINKCNVMSMNARSQDLKKAKKLKA